MIGRLTGRVAGFGPDHVLLEVGGVGYIVHVNERTRAALPADGAPAALFTELLVREDLLQLYGFATAQEREWHRLLTSVQGIGARASQAILGALGAEGVARAVALGDWAAVRAAPGVGPKLAQRVVNELKDKAAGVMAMGGDPAPAPQTAATAPTPAAPPAPPAPGGGAAQADALSALVNLGYGQSEAAAAIAQAAGESPEADASALIRAGLRRLAPGG